MLHLRARCSLSPRGDGYGHPVLCLLDNSDAAYPREGTVTRRAARRWWADSDAAYPREGTVTNITCFYRLFENDATYPREGTVTRY